ncbi:MAG: hypothetical protein IPK00_01755 [Deltaproteobacteria bacterium]|nr:hypothetical protein [Deltaproteobacteria bacterium]
MMRRFARRRRGPGDGQSNTIDGSQWWPKLQAEGLIPLAPGTGFEPVADSDVPAGVAVIARASLQDGTRGLVSFSPSSASDALVAGLAAAQQSSADAPFTGTLFVVAPHWPMAARQLLEWVGQTPYTVEPVAAVRLSDSGFAVESERAPRLLASSPAQLAARMGSSEARAAFIRAASSLEGLAAKHGGCVRVGIDRLELVVLARRVAEIRTEGENTGANGAGNSSGNSSGNASGNAVLETLVNGRQSTPLSAADLAGALDGLEGQLRRRLNDSKVRDGEDGLRGRVVAQLAAGTELRCVRPWPTPGTEVDVVDAVGVDGAGVPVIVAVRQEFEWTALVAVLEALSSLAPLMPLLLAEAGPPLRLGRPRLVLTAERFAPALERVVAALTLSFELRVVSGQSGPSLDLVQRAAGEGAESRFGRRGRRRGGRGRSDGRPDGRGRGGESDLDGDDAGGDLAGEDAREERAERSARGDRGERGDRSDRSDRGERAERTDRNPAIPLGPRAMTRPVERLDDDLDDDEADEAEAGDANGNRDREGREGGEAGRGRGRRRRRSRRGGSGGGVEGAASGADNGDEPGVGRERASLEGSDRESSGRDGSGRDDGSREGRGRDGGSRSARELDADPGDAANGAPRRPRFEEVSLMDLDEGPGSASPERAEGERGRGDRHRRSRRRGRRGGRGEDQAGPREASEEAGGDGPAASEAIALPLVGAEATIEDDFVDADDLSEILSRLPDEVPDYEAAAEPRYDDEEEEDGESPVRSFRGDARGRGRGEDEEESEDALRAAARRRAAILVHADPDSLLAAILLARDVRQLEGLWVYPQSELMTFFRGIATDLRDDMPIVVVGFSPSPARDVIQAAALYRGRLSWFDRHAWPPEDLLAMRNALSPEGVIGGEGLDSVLPLVLETCTRRSRFSDKLVDLATGRFSQHDFERWGRLWRHRVGEIAKKTGDIRGDIAALLAGRPSDLAKEAALLAIPPTPPEVEWVAARDFRLVHFGAHVMAVLDVDAGLDPGLCARIARERYAATLSLTRRAGEEVFTFAGDEVTGRRALDYQAVAHHLVEKLEWVEGRPDADHVARFRVCDLARRPERLEEVIAEIAMGRSQLER